MKEESIDGVDWTLFESAKTFGDLVPGVDGGCVLNEKRLESGFDFGGGEVFGGEG
jgi:hypothetical protein